MPSNTPEPLQQYGNSTTELAGKAGAAKQLVVDTTKYTAVIMDGVTLGGHPLAKESRVIKSGTEGLLVNDGEQATLASDIELKDKRRWLKRVEAIPADTTALLADMPVGGVVVTEEGDEPSFPYNYPGPYNTEQWITTSGTFTVPVTAWYNVKVINGGNGAVLHKMPTYNWLVSGASGRTREFFLYLVAGAGIPVTIGAAGVGKIVDTWEVSGNGGGLTYFGGYSTVGGFANAMIYGSRMEEHTSVAIFTFMAGCGFGGGQYGVAGLTGKTGSGTFYGAGGACATYDPRLDIPEFAGDGAPGAVRLRYFNPGKTA